MTIHYTTAHLNTIKFLNIAGFVRLHKEEKYRFRSSFITEAKKYLAWLDREIPIDMMPKDSKSIIVRMANDTIYHFEKCRQPSDIWGNQATFDTGLVLSEKHRLVAHESLTGKLKVSLPKNWKVDKVKFSRWLALHTDMTGTISKIEDYGYDITNTVTKFNPPAKNFFRYYTTVKPFNTPHWTDIHNEYKRSLR
jgi:hypothetical protein